MSSPYNIHLMHMSQDLRETITESYWREREEHKCQVERETNEICELEYLIYVYGFNEHAALYDAWSDAGPESRLAYLDYCRAEWARIVEEITLAHKLAGYTFTLVCQ